MCLASEIHATPSRGRTVSLRHREIHRLAVQRGPHPALHSSHHRGFTAPLGRRIQHDGIPCPPAVVYFAVDEEHARNVSAAIEALHKPRYANALHAFEASSKAFSEVPANGKSAIRNVYAAAECLFRLVVPDARAWAESRPRHLGQY